MAVEPQGTGRAESTKGFEIARNRGHILDAAETLVTAGNGGLSAKIIGNWVN
jgi:hypothetical protein